MHIDHINDIIYIWFDILLTKHIRLKYKRFHIYIYGTQYIVAGWARCRVGRESNESVRCQAFVEMGLQVPKVGCPVESLMEKWMDFLRGFSIFHPCSIHFQSWVFVDQCMENEIIEGIFYDVLVCRPCSCDCWGGRYGWSVGFLSQMCPTSNSREAWLWQHVLLPPDGSPAPN